MKLEANIWCSYEDDKISEAVASSVQPDNLDSPENVEVFTSKEGKRVESEVVVEGEIETLLATMDDLISCISTAEKMI